MLVRFHCICIEKKRAGNTLICRQACDWMCAHPSPFALGTVTVHNIWLIACGCSLLLDLFQKKKTNKPRTIPNERKVTLLGQTLHLYLDSQDFFHCSFFFFFFLPACIYVCMRSVHAYMCLCIHRIAGTLFKVCLCSCTHSQWMWLCVISAACKSPGLKHIKFFYQSQTKQPQFFSVQGINI